MIEKNDLAMERRKVPASPMKADDPFQCEVADLFNKIEARAYDLFLQRNGFPGNPLEDWFKAEAEILRPAPCEVMHKGNELMIRVEVPGFNQRELEIKVDVDRIFVRGHKEKTVQSSSEDRIFSDREYKDLFRQVPLPIRVDPTAVSTSLHEGVLTVFVRKADSAAQKGHAQAA